MVSFHASFTDKLKMSLYNSNDWGGEAGRLGGSNVFGSHAKRTEHERIIQKIGIHTPWTIGNTYRNIVNLISELMDLEFGLKNI